MTAPAPLDLPAVLDDLERAHAAATPGPWSAGRSSGTGTAWLDADGYSIGAAGLRADAAAIVAEHNAFPTLIAELRKRDAALRAVLAECDEVDRRRDHLRTTFGIEPLAGRVHVETIRATLTAALNEGRK